MTALRVVPIIAAGGCALVSRALHAHVRGIVQGVGFRWFVLQHARQLGVRGHTRNLPDGGVEVVAVGEERDVEALVQHLRAGPSAARVDSVECRALAEPPRYDDFEIR